MENIHFPLSWTVQAVVRSQSFFNHPAFSTPHVTAGKRDELLLLLLPIQNSTTNTFPPIVKFIVVEM